MSTAPISEWKRVPGYERATGLAPRRIAAVVLAGKKRSEVVWALSVPAESIHLVVENGAAKPSVLATLGFALFRRAALTMWRQATANSRSMKNTAFATPFRGMASKTEQETTSLDEVKEELARTAIELIRARNAIRSDSRLSLVRPIALPTGQRGVFCDGR